MFAQWFMENKGTLVLIKNGGQTLKRPKIVGKVSDIPLTFN
ncbi:hypothetical protein QG37_00366 [Candidozyma auris]|uniref:Uncharacterized protein n=1 Tax=Candidozyma auris TaxID=498019 RepID=A0A0L0P997_CANAR|nr:hypothetical protein QG37_00366 [[Candida] auris]